MKTLTSLLTITVTTLIGLIGFSDSASAVRRAMSSGSSNIYTTFQFEINNESNRIDPNGNFVGVIENIVYDLGNGISFYPPGTNGYLINTEPFGNLVSAEIINNSDFRFNIEITEKETGTDSFIKWTYSYSHPVNAILPDPTSLDSILNFMATNTSNSGFSTYSTAFEDFWLNGIGLDLNDNFRQAIQNEIASSPLFVTIENTPITTVESSNNFGILLLGMIGLGIIIKPQ
jgi:hypothetical protein